MKNMPAWLFKHKRVVYGLSSLPVLLILLYLIVNYFFSSLTPIGWTRIHLLGLPAAELLLVFFLLDRYHQSTGRDGWLYIVVFCLINLNIIPQLEKYYRDLALVGNAKVELALILTPIVSWILTITILVCCLMNLQFFKRLWQNFSFETDHPETSTRLNLVLLTALFIIGLAIRFYNLSGFPPYFDEYYHTSEAVHLLAGAPLDYNRAFLTVTLPVYLSFKTLGISLWSGRAIIVLISMLAVFPLYRLGSRLNPLVGWISVGLFVFSPYVIAASRNIREYAIAPVLFYTVTLVLLGLLDWDGLNFVQYARRHKYRIVLAALILLYLAIDQHSVLKITFSLYAIFGLLALIKVNSQDVQSRQKLTVLLVASALILLLVSYSNLFNRYKNLGGILYQQSDSYINILLASDIHQWYMTAVLGCLILILALALAVHAFFSSSSQTRYVFLFCFLAFASHMVYLTFFLISPRITERARYGILMEYWYLPLAAVAAWALFSLFKRLFGRENLVLSLVLLGWLFSNPQSVLSVINYQGGRYLEVTGDRHYILEPSHKFLEAQLTTQDVLITDLLILYDEINGHKLRPLQVFNYRQVEILETVEQHPRGWIALSVIAQPERHGLRFENFTHASKQVHYMGMKGEVNLWQWGPAQ